MGATNAANYKKEKEILQKLAKEVVKISAQKNIWVDKNIPVCYTVYDA